MSLALAESLVLSEAASARAVARALFLQATQQMSFVQALLATGAVDEVKLEAAVQIAGAPVLDTVTPAMTLVQKLPRGFCNRMLVVPIGRDEWTDAVEIAVFDPRDVHAAREAAYALQAEVQMHRATISALRTAIDALQRADASQVAERPAQTERTKTPIWGTPVVSVVPAAAPHVASGDMPIPLMRRSVAPASPTATARSAAVRDPRVDGEPPTERDAEPVFALRPAPSVRRPALAMVAETQITEVRRPAARENTAVTIPAPREDPRHTMVTSPAPARRSEAPPVVVMPRQTRAPSSLPPRRSELPPRASGLAPLPLADVEPVLAAMEEANDRDAIVALLISGLRTCARRVAVMAVKRDAFVGWSCNAEFGDARAWRSVHVPTSLPSVFATAAAGTTYLGPLFRTDGHEPVVAFMKETSRDVAVAGVRVDMHPVLVLVADELADTALGTKRLEQLAKAASASLARVLRKPASPE